MDKERDLLGMGMHFMPKLFVVSMVKDKITCNKVIGNISANIISYM